MKHTVTGTTMRMMKMSGKMNDVTMKALFNEQMRVQDILLSKGVYGFRWDEKPTLPFNDDVIANNQVLHLISEIGEVLEADKRWKSFRNDKYDPAAKVEELADCFIILMNIAMFSGIDCEEFIRSIQSKIDIVRQRADSID